MRIGGGRLTGSLPATCGFFAAEAAASALAERLRSHRARK
jgi:hypothetical protein